MVIIFMRDHILGKWEISPFFVNPLSICFHFPKFSKIFVVPRATIFGPKFHPTVSNFWMLMVMRDHILRSEQVAPFLSTNLKPASGLELHFKFPFCLLLDSVVNRKELKFSPDFSYSSGSSYLQTFMPASSLWIVIVIHWIFWRDPWNFFH